jgi:hypothetical protein
MTLRLIGRYFLNFTRDCFGENLTYLNVRIGPIMCSRVNCKKCGKPTWSGCGDHIEEALEGVPNSQRCQGHENDPKKPGLFSKLFHRR